MLQAMAGRIVIGIDAGSAAVSAVAMDEDGELLASAYEYHKGRIASGVRALIDGLLPDGTAARIHGAACTASSPPLELPSGRALRVDGRVSEIESLGRYHRDTRTLLVVGAERFARIAFDESGRYRRMRGNSSCAAGTGSFLDQQAARLGLPGGSAELAARAIQNKGGYPSIASRCSVFAKTDLIHAQAEGWSVGSICEGLCHGLARNIADTLFPGESPRGPDPHRRRCVAQRGGPAPSLRDRGRAHLGRRPLPPLRRDRRLPPLPRSRAWSDRSFSVGEILV